MAFDALKQARSDEMLHLFLQMHEESRMSCLVAADARLMQAWSPRSCETVPGSGNAQPGRSSSCCSSMLEARGGSSGPDARPLGMAGARRRGAERRNLSPTDAASAHESKEPSVKEHAPAMKICKGGAPSFPHHANTSVAGSYPS